MMQDRPLWMKLDKPRFTALDGARRCDVAVVGGGLTGVTTALLLAQKGVRTAVVEADEIGGGTSGRTTAKVTAQHDVRLHGLGESKARDYMAANQSGLQLISRLIGAHSIRCDFARCPAYVYARGDDEEAAVEQEMAMYERIGISARLTKDVPLPYPVRSALVLDDQASFHPLKYLYALAGVLVSLGVSVHESSRVVDIERGEDGVTVRTEQGTLHAKAVIIATGYPLLEYPGLFFLRVHQERSYLMAARLSVETGGMGITAGDPVNSVRTLRMDDKDWLLAGGFGHKTGQEDKKDNTGYDPLRDFLRCFGKAEPEYRWSAQDCETLDTIPYVGALYREGPQVYVATGYGKWGMTNSAAAAQMLCDLITGESAIDPDVRALFDPLRVAPVASAKNFFVQTADTLRAFTAGRAGIETGDFDDIKPGEGAVKRVDGKARAIYKDPDGNIRMFSASCTHLKCPVEYNAVEKTFDCQCHGSRFSLTGDVIEGPAQLPLAPATDDD
jgi:glycine/D-amino acid oxidase-like deaminating enzyme/nitrite reductase/ring-hydroxylating ferredoxin subunit